MDSISKLVLESNVLSHLWLHYLSHRWWVYSCFFVVMCDMKYFFILSVASIAGEIQKLPILQYPITQCNHYHRIIVPFPLDIIIPFNGNLHHTRNLSWYNNYLNMLHYYNNYIKAALHMYSLFLISQTLQYLLPKCE